MHTPLACLLGFVLWTLFIVAFGIAGSRLAAAIGGQIPEGGFSADTPQGSPRYRRIMRAHMNCVENLPLFAVVVLTGAVVHAGSPLMDTLALAYLAARVLQSSFHIASGGPVAIALRFTCFLAQNLILAWMGVLVWRVLDTQLV
jgi:uncharacterized MAPEG superfamily protein